jgi:hypothetical protein
MNFSATRVKKTESKYYTRGLLPPSARAACLEGVGQGTPFETLGCPAGKEGSSVTPNTRLTGNMELL